MLSRTKAKGGAKDDDDQWPHVVFTHAASAPDGAIPTAPEQGTEEEDEEDTLLYNGSQKIVVIQRDGDEKPALTAAPTADSNGKSGVGVPARYIFTVLGFLAFFTIYCLRTCLPVALVAMVNSTALAADDNNDNDNNNVNSSNTSYISHASKHCPGAAADSSNMTADFLEGEFAWDERTQGFVLGAFYYGYILPQLLGGWLADRFKGKWLLGGSLLMSSLLSFAIPSAARAGSSYLIALRVVQGLVESATFPGMHVLCAEWVPVQERAKLVSFAYSGCELGTVCGMLLTGVLSRYGFAGGWPSAFYVFGMMGCVWFVLWVVLVFDSPAQHPRISDRERRYIQESIGTRDKVKIPTPWRALLTSAPVWAVCVAHTSYNWGYYSMITSLPTFLKQILHFHIVTNGFLSALPYLLMWLTQVLAAIASDHLRRYVSVGFVRKLMFTLGSVIPACFMVATGYVDCDHTLAVALVTIGVSGKGMAASAMMVNHLDFAPQFAGTLFGLSNTFASIPGFLGPALIGFLTYTHQTIVQWRKFFYITAAIYVASILLFLCLGSGQLQPWAAPLPTCISVPDPLQLNEKEKSALEEKLNLHLHQNEKSTEHEKRLNHPEQDGINSEEEKLNPLQNE